MSSETHGEGNTDHAAAGNDNDAVGGGGGVQDKSLKDDIYTATAYGDLEKLRNLVEIEGCSVNQPNECGYRALQWAALNNRVAVAQYILERGADVNAGNLDGQTALHWSAVRGHIQVADLLLEQGAQVNVADVYGYQTTHVAAQYGQTAYLYHIVTKWNADADITDKNGRTPLHWAAYKGFSDSICLLLFLDAYTGRQDEEGCTPLHWAAIRGNFEASEILVQAGKKDVLMVTDNTGLTPAQLASDKKHRKVASSLVGQATKMLENRYEGIIGTLLDLRPALALLCVIFMLLLTYINSVIMASSLPKLTAGSAFFAWIGVTLSSAGLILFYRCSCKDPGYIKANRNDSNDTRGDEPLLKLEVWDPVLLAGNWTQLCAACKIVRPLHAQHCATCERCVEQFDHHCPFVYNCIGKKNKWDFLFFLVLEVFAMVITGSVALTRIVRDPLAPSSIGAWLLHFGNQHIGVLLFIVPDFFLLYYVAILTYKQISQNSKHCGC